jgi:uncharacterized protein YcfJ
MHATPQRLRLRYSEHLPEPELDGLLADLSYQSWVVELQHRPSTRSIVVALAPGCPEVRWPLALAALGWQLDDPPGARSQVPVAPVPVASVPVETGGWSRVVRQVGGNMIGAVVGQLVFGGIGGALGAWWFGTRGALIFGASGALVGGIAGAVIGAELVDQESSLRKGEVVEPTIQRLGIRLGEEAGSSAGVLIGTALAGPVGAMAGMALGSMLVGQLSQDLIVSRKAHGARIGSAGWFASTIADTAGETLSEGVMAQLGRSLTGGSEAGAKIGANIGMRLGRKVDWTTSLQRHHAVNRLAPST